MIGKRHYRDDEEPDKEWVSILSSGHCCEFCGLEDHETKDCPVKPPFKI